MGESMTGAPGVQRSEAIAQVLSAWDGAKISYAVLHGLEDFPERVGRDIDCLFGPGSTAIALRLSADALQRLGFSVAWPHSIWGQRLVAFHGDDWDSGIEIHAVPRVAWQNVQCATTAAEATVLRNGVKTDVWASFAKRVLLPLWAEGSISKVLREAPLPPSERPLIAARLKALIGEELANRFIDAFEIHDEKLLAKMLPELRRRARTRAWMRAPGRSLAASLRQAVKRVVYRCFPCTPVVALVGPDGVGKSTILNILRDGERSVFSGIVVRHWRPSLLPPIGAWFRSPGSRRRTIDPEANETAPRRKPGKLPLFRGLYYLLDFWAGGWIKDRSASALQRIVLYDRCVLDMSVDPVRYGLREGWVARLLWRMAPRPNLVILLAAEPELIHQRKQELPVEEIGRQIAAWEGFHRQRVVQERIDVSAEPDAVARKIRRAIVAKFLAMNHAEAPAQNSREQNV